MNVIVDTSVWSLALRRNKSNIESQSVKLLKSLITEGKVIVLNRNQIIENVRGYDFIRESNAVEVYIRD